MPFLRFFQPPMFQSSTLVSDSSDNGSSFPNPRPGFPNSAPTTQSEFFFYNLLICALAGELAIATDGNLNGDTADYMVSAKQWMLNAWVLTGDYY